ncbi:MAG TPA: flavodoxin family protein [Lachnospiraceae bacterium]|nr:flavodoxin family protein [Lachnospiraceae bacterium]
MKVVIVFKSKKNTKKIADAIGKALQVKPMDIDEIVKVDDADILFLGCGIYAGDVPNEVKDFVKTLNSKKIKKVVLFTTSGRGDDQTEKLKEEIRHQGLTLEERTFCCKGQMFLFMNRSFPCDTDLQNAEIFAKIFYNMEVFYEQQ